MGRAQIFKLSQALILIGLAFYFAFIVLSGRWAFYIDPRFQWLSVVAVLLFTLLALSHLFGSSRSETNLDDPLQDEHTKVVPLSIVVLLIPLILGFIIPARPLGASAIKTRGIDTDFSSITLSANSNRSLTIIP
ncbi:MAG: DUF1980 domain-containing protein, partial [Chloroflexi bacterium]